MKGDAGERQAIFGERKGGEGLIRLGEVWARGTEGGGGASEGGMDDGKGEDLRWKGRRRERKKRLMARNSA